MAQIAISDEDLQDLSVQADIQGLTAEEMLSRLIHALVAADQLAFWGLNALRRSSSNQKKATTMGYHPARSMMTLMSSWQI